MEWAAGAAALEVASGQDLPGLRPELGRGGGPGVEALQRSVVVREDGRCGSGGVDDGVVPAVAERAAFERSSWFDAIGGRYDLIVSNPPYIAAGDPLLARGDLPAEPHLALTPGPSGLEALRSIIAGAPGHLRAGGMLMLEHGYDQRAAVQNLMREQGFEEVATVDDFNGLPRMTGGVYNRN